MKDLDMFVIEEDHKYRKGIVDDEPTEQKVGFCKRHKKLITFVGFLYLFGWVMMNLE